jgi:hypothetical protein
MTPAEKIAEMIEELPQEDQEKVTEYIELLRFEGSSAYREFVLNKLSQADQASARGESLDADEGRDYLLKLLAQ